MKVKKSDAVAICQDYGLATADGWDDQKLAKKFGEMLRLFRSGEYVPSLGQSSAVLQELADDSEDGFELVEELEDVPTIDDDISEEEEDEDDWEDDKKEEESCEEGDPEDCPLQGGERVLVGASDGNWKGIVVKPVTDRRVLVRDKDKKEYEEPIENCKEVERKPKKNEDDGDRKIRELKDEIEAMEGVKTSKEKRVKKRKLTREETVVQLLRKSGSFLADDLVSSVEELYTKRGGSKNANASDAAAKRIVKYGTMFGAVQQTGNEVVWTGPEQEK